MRRQTRFHVRRRPKREHHGAGSLGNDAGGHWLPDGPTQRERRARVTVTAYDAYGNVADDYRGTVELRSSGSRHALLVNDYTSRLLMPV